MSIILCTFTSFEQVFNSHQESKTFSILPSHHRPHYPTLHASKRTMNRFFYLNSKVLYKEVRKDYNMKKLKPVIVHINHHPDKFLRMKAVVDFYFNGPQDALELFPDGSC